MHSLRHFILSTLVALSSFSVTTAQSPTLALSASTTSSGISQSTAAPACANSCVGTATLTQSCAPGDQTCLCSYSTQIQESIYNCIITTSAKCSSEEKTQAFEYYPAFCRSLNLAVETNIPTVLMTAAGSAPTAGAVDSNSTSSGSSTPGSTGTPSSSKNLHRGLQLPAILGITLAVVIMIVVVIVIMVWSFVRRRQAIRRPRMDLGGELAESKPRPPRSKSVNSDFMVQPSPVEKDSLEPWLSRTSTLVPPPPVAKDAKRSSDEKRKSARNKTLKALLGADGLRSSLLSKRSSSKRSSLMVPPLDLGSNQGVSQKADGDLDGQIRLSKF